MAFVEQLEAWKAERLAPIVGAGRMSLSEDAPGSATQLLQIALANEINVSELAAAWMPSTREIDVKLAFARQAGDEAGHFQLVAERLTALGFDVAGFAQTDNPMFQYLRGLTTTVERIAAGLFTLESIAYGVNENFMAFCEQRGDAETVRIYREYIQPDERAHQQLGQRLLAKYATTPELEQLARDTVSRLLEIAGATRASAAARLGTACFPGC
ncbi:MAG TPA: ferritin-like domain-containing protein [Kofleriaceae bacterium]